MIPLKEEWSKPYYSHTKTKVFSSYLFAAAAAPPLPRLGCCYILNVLSNLSLRSSSTAAQCVLQPQPKAVDDDDDAAQPAIFSVLPEIPFHLSFIFHFKAIGPLVTGKAYLISGAIGTAARPP